MKQLTPSEVEELTLRFKGIFEVDNKIEGLKENIKNYNSSKKEMIKMIAQKLEIKQKEVKKGYETYIKKLQNPEEVEAEEEVFVLIKEFNLLGKEVKK